MATEHEIRALVYALGRSAGTLLPGGKLQPGLCVTLTLVRRAVSVRLAECGTSIRDIAVKKKQRKLTKGQIAMTVAAVLIIASMVLTGVASVFTPY